MNIEQIAKTCHAVHLAYCSEMLFHTQPKWDELQNEHRETIIDSVQKIVNGTIKSKEDSHNNFIKNKKKNGWIYGETYSLIDKINPRLIGFDDLSLEQRIKEALFFECVTSFIN